MKKITNVFRTMFRMDKELGRSGTTVTNACILKEIVKHFTEELNYRSVGKKMIYPMTFYVNLHQDDYQVRKDDFPFFLSEIVDGFYQVILKNIKNYPNYKGPAANWNFYLVPCMEPEFSVGGHKFSIKPGNVIIWGSLYDLMDTDSGEQNKNVNVSVRLDNSKLLTNININHSVMQNLQFLDENHIRVDWKDPVKAMQQKNSQEKQNLPDMKIGVGVLSYVQTGCKEERFVIRTNSCKLSGEGDTRQDPSVFKIKHSKVGIQHAEIKYNRMANTFELVAYQPASINGVSVPLSEGGELKWVPLPNGSIIVLADSVVINFKKLI